MGVGGRKNRSQALTIDCQALHESMNLAQDIPLNTMLCVIGSLSCVFDAKANALVTVIVVVSVSCSFRFSCSLRRFYRRIRSWYKDERCCGQAALG